VSEGGREGVRKEGRNWACPSAATAAKMFKSLKKKPDKVKEKLDFKLSFHATRVSAVSLSLTRFFCPLFFPRVSAIHISQVQSNSSATSFFVSFWDILIEQRWRSPFPLSSAQ
jgi:hypothetical protein